jgi:hypothetical protein
VACNHFVPLWRERGPINTTRAQLKHDLSILAPLIHAEKWGALGGEPTLHKDLVALLNIARDSGVATETEVWTNGAFLRRMSDEFWESFDILVLSVYPGQHTESQMDWIRERCHQAKVTLDLKDEVHRPNFRTILEPTPTSHDVTKQKFDACFFRKFSRNASFGFFFTCCCGPHIRSRHPQVSGAVGTFGGLHRLRGSGDGRSYSVARGTAATSVAHGVRTGVQSTRLNGLHQPDLHGRQGGSRVTPK